MARSDATDILGRAFVLWCGVIAVGTLYFAKDVLLPLGLAFLLTFLLAPIVSRLERWRFRRIPAVLTVVAVAFAGIAALSYVLALQMYDFAYRLPEYKNNIVAKVESIQGKGDGVFQNVSRAFDEVRQKISQRPPHGESADKEDLERPDSTAPLANVDASHPLAVEVVNNLSPTQIAQSILGPIISPIGTTAMVAVFVIFMLLEREKLRNRLIHLVASRQLNTATQALDDAASRVSKFLLMQLIVNSAFGLVVAGGLFMIGLPNAILWGVLAAVLRFVPYIGPFIAAAIPIAIASAVFPGWTRPLLVIALFIVNELISNNVVEPWLYGSSTGISTMGILVSAVFWTWLWGPVGLVMATPLTVCLTVLGRHVPQLAFLNTLLSEDEVLPTASRLYQRLLATDPEEATDIAEEYLKDHSLEALYDDVLLPALSLAEHDRHHGNLDEVKERFILASMRELVDDIGVKATILAPKSTDVSTDAPPSLIYGDVSVLCLPARDEADEIAGLMLTQLLTARSVHVELISVQTLSGEMVERVATEKSAVVCVSAVPPLAATHARYLCKRLRPKLPDLRIIVGLWHLAGSGKKAEARLKEAGAVQVVTSLAEAVQQLTQVVASIQLLVPAESDEAVSIANA